MQPPMGSQSQPVTRRYFQDAHYQADAANMAAAGWRVVSLQREPSNAIVATYAPISSQSPAQGMPPATPTGTRPSNPLYVSDETQRRALRIGGGVLGGLLLLAIIACAISAIGAAGSGSQANSNQPGSGSNTSPSVNAQATDTAVTASFDATATAYAVNTPVPAPTSTPAPVLVSGARLGGPLSDFDAKYGAESSQGTWYTTIAGEQVQLVVFITHSGDSLDSQDRAVSVNINGLSGSNWSATQDAAIVAAFLPNDATHIRTGAGFGSLGPDHIYVSKQLADSLAADVFQDSNEQQLTPGTFDWQCSTSSTTSPFCEIAPTVNS